MSTWDMGKGVVEFPSGRRIRGRSWGESVCEYADVTAVLTTATAQEFAERNAPGIAHDVVYISWPDYRIPRRPQQAKDQLRQLFDRAAHERVEITCGGGVGRTGTALAMLAMMDGLAPAQAIEYVQNAYNPDSVSSHAQRGFLMAMGRGDC